MSWFKKTKKEKPEEAPVTEATEQVGNQEQPQEPVTDPSESIPGNGEEEYTMNADDINAGEPGKDKPVKKKTGKTVAFIVTLIALSLSAFVITIILLSSGKKQAKPRVGGMAPIGTPAEAPVPANPGGTGGITPPDFSGPGTIPPAKGAAIPSTTPASSIQAPVSAAPVTPAVSLPPSAPVQILAAKQENKQTKAEILTGKDIERKKNTERELGLKSTVNPFKEKYLAKIRGEGKTGKGKHSGTGQEQDIDKLLNELKPPPPAAPISLPPLPPPPAPEFKLTVYGVVVSKNGKDSVALTDKGELVVGRKLNDLNTVTAITFSGVEVSGAGFFAVNAKNPAVR